MSLEISLTVTELGERVGSKQWDNDREWDRDRGHDRYWDKDHERSHFYRYDHSRSRIGEQSHMRRGSPPLERVRSGTRNDKVPEKKSSSKEE